MSSGSGWGIPWGRPMPAAFSVFLFMVQFSCFFCSVKAHDSTTQSCRVKTRSEPKSFPDGRRLHVYPPDYFGPRQETHSIEVDFDIFEGLTHPDPLNRHAVYHAMDLNFALKGNGKAVDAGVVIPTVNENFAGRAPDLGAIETGQPIPHYGPRWLTWKPFYR